MPEEQNQTEQINFDELTSKVKDVPKKQSLETILPSLIYAFNKKFAVDKGGHFGGFKEANDENKNQLADVITEELFYILATKYFKIPEDEFNQLKKFNRFTDEFGDHIYDTPLTFYMGMNRRAILNAIKGVKRFNNEIVFDIGVKATKTHQAVITSKLLEPIQSGHIQTLKDWIVKNSEGKFEKEIKDLYDLDKLKQYFLRTIAKDYGQAEHAEE